MSEPDGHVDEPTPERKDGSARQSSVPSKSQSTEMTSATAPPAVQSVLGEVHPGDPGMWRPQSYNEWEALQRTRTFLAAWSEQVADERTLRRTYAKAIFILIAAQVFGVFGIVIAEGLDLLAPHIGLLKIVLPGVLSEVFGLGFLVTKYLFSQPLRASMDALATGARPTPLPADPAEPTTGPRARLP